MTKFKQVLTRSFKVGESEKKQINVTFLDKSEMNEEQRNEVDWNKQVDLAKRRVLKLRQYRQLLIKEIELLERHIEKLYTLAEETEITFQNLGNRLDRSRQKLDRMSRE